MTTRRLAALLGLLAVVFGTFGAHGVEGSVPAENMDWWHTAVLYHLFHALAILACGRGGLDSPPMRAGWFFAAGTLIFSGSLYLLTLTGWRWLGMITPIGGLLFLVGWLLLLIRRPAPSAQ